MEEIRVASEWGAVVSSVGKVCHRRSNAVHECKGDNLASPLISVAYNNIFILTSISLSESKQSFPGQLIFSPDIQYYALYENLLEQ